jgi:hypothetical protein
VNPSAVLDASCSAFAVLSSVVAICSTLVPTRSLSVETRLLAQTSAPNPTIATNTPTRP